MFDIKIWLVKWAKKMSLVVIATALLFTAEELAITDFPPEYTFWAGLLIIILSQVGNFIKHEYIES